MVNFYLYYYGCYCVNGKDFQICILSCYIVMKINHFEGGWDPFSQSFMTRIHASYATMITEIIKLIIYFLKEFEIFNFLKFLYGYEHFNLIAALQMAKKHLPFVK